MQPMMPGYGWGTPNWQPHPVAGNGNNMYWPNRNGFPEAPGNGNVGFNSSLGHPVNQAGGFRGPQLARQQSFTHPQRRSSSSVDDQSRLPPIPVVPPQQGPSSANSSCAGSFRQQVVPMNAGNSGRGSFRLTPSCGGNMVPTAPGSFRQPMQMQPPETAQSAPPQLLRDPGHLAPLQSPVAELPDTTPPISVEGEQEIEKELSQLVGRKTSSKRILRRQVSFQGIRLTDEERRLQAELQRLREEEARRTAAEVELRQQRFLQEQEEMERARAEEQQRQKEQQSPQGWSPQFPDSEDAFDQPYYDPSQPSTPQARYSPSQTIMGPGVVPMMPNQSAGWNSFRGPQQPQQQQGMYGMYYGGQLPPVARFPQQNGFPMNGAPPQMMAMYQQQQMMRRF